MADGDDHEQEFDGHDGLPHDHSEDHHVLRVPEDRQENELNEVLLQDHHKNNKHEDVRVRERVISLHDFRDKAVIHHQQVHQHQRQHDLDHVQPVVVQLRLQLAVFASHTRLDDVHPSKGPLKAKCHQSHYPDPLLERSCERVVPFGKPHHAHVLATAETDCLCAVKGHRKNCLVSEVLALVAIHERLSYILVHLLLHHSHNAARCISLLFLLLLAIILLP